MSNEALDLLERLKDLCDDTQSTFVLRYEYGKFEVALTPCSHGFYPRDDVVQALSDVINYLIQIGDSSAQ